MEITESRFIRSLLRAILAITFTLVLLPFVETYSESVKDQSQSGKSTSNSPNAANLSAIVLPMGGLNATSANYGISMTIGETVVGRSSAGGKNLSLGFQSVVAQSMADCGDINGSGGINIADVVYLVNYIFAGGPSPLDISIGDVNCSGSTNIADVVYLVNYIFANGPATCDAC